MIRRSRLRIARSAFAALFFACVAFAAVGPRVAALERQHPRSASIERQGRRANMVPHLVALEPSFAELGNQATDALLRSFYDGRGLWRDCPARACFVHNTDWGSDSLTDTLYLRWITAHDPRIPPLLAALARTSRQYPNPCRTGACGQWSDVPMWDSVAASREYQADPTDTLALAKAKAAYATIEDSPVYDVGACPAIRYQRPFGRGDQLKTLESDSNAVKAALLLYEETKDGRYLRSARVHYDAIRQYFLDPQVPLYSVYVFDDGHHCAQVPHRYFASVNGNMIWNGLHLARATGQERYRTEAVETARAVDRQLSDPNGVFSDLQAENDLEEPLVEAMFELATSDNRMFAHRWLVDNASAAFSARKADGTYGRFFDGPPPSGPVTAWQTNGGFAAEIAAAALNPAGTSSSDGWQTAKFTKRDLTRFPARIVFRGSGIALIGTLGERCCQPGHARVFVDGAETTNQIGLWQNKSSSGLTYPGAVLFAWRWPSPGRHEISFAPGLYDAKEGGPFLHVRGYWVR